MTATLKRLTVLLLEDPKAPYLRQALNEFASKPRLIGMPAAEHAISYLRGRGKYSDRNAWPLPDIVLLPGRTDGLSGLDIVSWVRRDPRMAALPAVVVSQHFTPAEAEKAERLGAALCSAPNDPAATLEAIEQAIGLAPDPVGHAWFGTRSAYAGSHRPDGAEVASIRVWT